MASQEDIPTGPSSALPRRTILAGAAWSIPAIALATATPAYAASEEGQPTLTFTQSSYLASTCAPLGGVEVLLTSDGSTPDPGKTVTISLDSGYTFADGSTSFTGVTDENGLLQLPDIIAPATPTTAAFTASSGTLVASSPVESTATSQLIYFYDMQSGTTRSYGVLPAGVSILSVAASQATTGSSPGSQAAFLGSDGNLYTYAGGVIASDVAGFDIGRQADNTNVAWYVTDDGVIHLYNFQTQATTTYATLPAGVTPVAVAASQAPTGSSPGSQAAILGSDGVLYTYGGGVIASNVTGFDVGRTAANQNVVWYTTSDGVVHFYNFQSGTTTDYGTLPAGVTVVDIGASQANTGDSYGSQAAILGSDGVLYRYGGGEIASDVTSFDVGRDSAGRNVVWYTTSDGVVHLFNYQTGTTTDYGALPAGVTVVDIAASQANTGDSAGSQAAILGSDGNLYSYGGGVIASSVTGFDVGRASDGHNVVFYSVESSC